MNKLNKMFLIIIIIIVIISIVAILMLLRITSKEKADLNVATPPSSIGEIEYEDELSQQIYSVKSDNDFATLEKEISNFFLYLKVDNKQAIYNILEETYIQENDITTENVIEIMNKQYKNIDGNFVLKQAYVRESLQKPIYYIYGYLEKDNKKADCYMIIYWDLINSTFGIKPINDVQYNQYITEKIKENNDIVIETKSFNKLTELNLTDEEKADRYFKDYIKNAIYDPEYSYERLDKTYKEKRFPTLQEYKKYLSEKDNELLSLAPGSIKIKKDFKTDEEYLDYVYKLNIKNLSKYDFKKFDDYIQCECIDEYGNYYNFKITAAMQYTVILDNYTLQSAEKVKTYKQYNTQKKVAYNIDKFINMINNKDYKQSYEVLADSFKNNNYRTQESFEKYIKANLFEHNQIEYVNFSNEGNTYIYKIALTDKDEENGKKINMTVIMQLQEETNFVMSFSI